MSLYSLTMPKILNLTIEEKAERYDRRYKQHHLSIEEKAEKWDAFRARNAKDCISWASKHPDKIKLAATEHYEKNKVELNKNSVIRIRNTRALKKANSDPDIL